MKRFSEQLQNKALNIRLNAAEKRELRERVVSYMEYHPLSAKAKTTAKTNKVLNNEFGEVTILQVSWWRAFQVTGAVLGALVLSISYFAEQAVPGDSLYAVKVKVNEELRSTLTLSPYQKVVWETERLNRRIAEARLLASEGRLTEAVEVEVANAVREHSENARREIEVLKQTDKEEATLASIQLTTALDVQTTSLRNDANAGVSEGMSTDLITSVLVETQQNEVAAGQSELPSYTRLIAEGEQETTRAYELLQSVHKVATEEEKVDIKRRLEDIERSMAEAINESSSDEVLAREHLIEILQRAQKLIVFMTNIDVRNSVTVEEIVPITLTLEERQVMVKKTAEEIITILNRADEVLSGTSTEVELKDKLIPASQGARTDADKVLVDLLVEGTDLSALEAMIQNAKAVTDDIAALLNLDNNAVETKVEPEIVVPEVDSEVASTSASTTQEVATTTNEQIEGETVVDESTNTEAI
jgi:hypothetical protein